MHRYLRKIAQSITAMSLVAVSIPPIQALANTTPSSNTTSNPVELQSYDTQYSNVYQNPDDTISSKVYFAPVNYKDGHGNWKHIDTTLTHDSSGYGVTKNLFNTHFASETNSSVTSTTPLETVTYHGHQVSFLPVSSALSSLIGTGIFAKLQSKVPGHVTKNIMRYSGIYPNVSLEDTVTSLGVKEAIVLDKYVPGLHSFAFVLNTDGLTPEVEKDGSLDFKDASGNTVFTMPHGVMADSNIDPHSGEPQTSNAVTYSILHVAGKTILRVSADEKWLSNSSRVYPVYIDPTVQLSSQITNAYVSSAAPTTNYSGTDLYNANQGYNDVHVGDYDSTTGDNWGYFKLPVASQLPLLGLTVKSATFHDYCDWSYYSTTPMDTWLYANTSANWVPSTVTWSNKPTASVIGSASVARDQWASWNITNTVQQWSNELQGKSFTSDPEMGFMMNENGNGQTYWHKFVAAGSSSNNPYIDITYDPPSAPWGAMYTHDDSNGSGYVNLWWNSVPNAASYDVEIYDGHQYETINVKPSNGNSGVQEWTSLDKKIWPTQSEIQQGDWELYHTQNGNASGDGGELALNPSPVYTNAFNKMGSPNYNTSPNYWFRIAALTSDGQITDVSNPFTPTMQAYIPDRGIAPTMVPLFVGQADGATGNFVLQATDLATSGHGPQVSIDRTYNQNTYNTWSPLGNGWMMRYQTHISIINNQVHLIGPDGHESVFWQEPDGTYGSPPGLTADKLTPVKSSGTITGYDLETSNNNTEEFQKSYTTSNGTQEYLLSGIQDTNGNHLSVTTNSYGNVTSITDASGRTTTFNYNSNGLIKSISFAFNSTTNEVWNYGYDSSNDLTSVTDPQGDVTKYGYTNGQLTSETTPNGNTYTIGYDTNGRMSSETNPANKSESVTYGSGSATFTDPNGIKTVLTYNDDHMTTKETQDPTGLDRTWSYKYNEFGEVTSETDPKGNVTSYQYDPFGQLLSVTDPNSSTATESFGQSGWNSVNHDVLKTQTPSAAQPYHFQYDGNDQTVGQTPDNMFVGDTYLMNSKNENNGLVSNETKILPDNPLSNNSFEQWTNGLPTGWGFQGDGTSTDSSESNFGKNSWEVTGSSSGNPAELYQTATTPVERQGSTIVTPGIGFSVYAKASNLAAAHSTYVQINYFDQNGKWLTAVDGPKLNVANQWARLSMSVNTNQIPSGAYSYHPVIITAPTGSDNVKFDAADYSPRSPLVPMYNALLNGDFANGSSNWWLSTGSTLPTDSSYTYGGNSHSAKIQDQSSLSTGIWPSDSNEYIPYVSGQKYTLSTYLKGQSASNSFVTLEFFNSSHGYLGQVSSPGVSGTFDWSFQSVTLPSSANIPSGTAYIRPEVEVDSGSGTTYVDDVQLTFNPVSTSYKYGSKLNTVTSITDPLGNQTEYGYDGEGNVSSVTSPNGTTYDATYNGDHQVSSQSSNISTTTSGTSSLSVNYSYDGDGNQTGVTAKSTVGSTTTSSTTSSLFNNLDELKSFTDQLGNTTSFLYDADGRLTETDLPDGHKVSTTFDNAGEPTAVSVDGTTINSFGYDKDGNITNAKNNNDNITFGYDKNGNIISQSDNVGSQTFSYNKDNLPTALNFTVGSTSVSTANDYNNEDKLTSVSSGSNTLGSYSYNGDGQYDTVNLHNGYVSHYGYDGTGNLESLIVSDGVHSPLLDESFAYNKDGNITGVTNAANGANVASYQYDGWDRLTQETDNGKTTTYAYDAFGNIESKTAGSTTTSYQYNAVNELTSVNGQTYTYDKNGNLVSDGNHTYKWNELGQLIEVDNASGGVVASYTYDALGRRASETANGTTTKFFYQGQSTLVMYETDGSGNLLQSYTYGPNGEPLTLTTWSGGTGTTYYYNLNQHGDVIALTDSSGATVASYTYDAWGNILTSTGAMASENPYLYAGYRWDSAVGMYYLNARYYKPDIMRFISRDPLGGTNAYTYASDNPVNMIDPTGEFSWRKAAHYTAVGLLSLGEGFIDIASDGAAAVDTPEEIALDAKILGEGTGKFTQTTASPYFSDEGLFSGKTIGQVSQEIRSGDISVKNVPVQYIVRDGNKLILNTRSALALKRAGISESDWNLVNLTGNPTAEEVLTQRLARNGLSNSGTDVLRITGNGQLSSNLQ